jgi:4-amino-4-deoxy-L-arabinose transferase-like glycosyltransferase
VSRRRSYLLIGAVCAIPRLGVLLYERSAIVDSFTEKSWWLAQVYVASGTFGYAPHIPTGQTQPLYGFFLIPIVWLFGTSWLAVGLAQIAVAIGTALLVYEIGLRLMRPRFALLAALVSTLEPYLVWHDVHINREILDQPLGAAMILLTLATAERRSGRLAVLLGAVSGVAILSNSRLTALPLVLAAFLLWTRVRPLALLGLLVACALTLSPWLIRNKLDVGCFAITTDSRALWKANNLATYTTLAHGGTVDGVPNFPGAPPTPETNWYLYRDHKPTIAIDECAQMTLYENKVLSFWAHHPGAKLKLMVQATSFLWGPSVRDDQGGPSPTGLVATFRTVVEPFYMVPLYVLALAGFFFVPVRFRVLAGSFLLYETAEAWVFAGNTRYRIAWDFVLSLLAAATLARVPWSRLRLRRRASQ